MTYEDLETLIASIGLPCSYNHFDADHAPPLPCICFYYDTRHDFVADNCVYAKIVSLSIDLYTTRKDLAVENRVEDVLHRAEMVYTKNESFEDGAQAFCETYVTTVMLRGDPHGQEQRDPD